MRIPSFSWSKPKQSSEGDDAGNPVWKQYHQTTPGSVQPCAKLSIRVKCKRDNPTELSDWLKQYDVGNPQEPIQRLGANWQKQPLWADKLQHGFPPQGNRSEKEPFQRRPRQECALARGAQADLRSTPHPHPHPLAVWLCRAQTTHVCVSTAYGEQSNNRSKHRGDHHVALTVTMWKRGFKNV